MPYSNIHSTYIKPWVLILILLTWGSLRNVPRSSRHGSHEHFWHRRRLSPSLLRCLPHSLKLDKNSAFRTYSRAHKLFGHSRVFILSIMIYVKWIIFSNDCISKRLKDRKLKLFHNVHQTMHDKTNIYTYGLSCKEHLCSGLKSSYSNDRALFAL